MSNVIVSDKRGGMFRAVIEFTYGECERLPFNLLRRVNARIETVPQGGITATADFNIRNPKDSARFLELLELFGEDGSFVHGSAADPSALSLNTPSEDQAPAKQPAKDQDDDLEVEAPLPGTKAR